MKAMLSLQYYLCNERINDVLCLPVVEGSWVGRVINFNYLQSAPSSCKNEYYCKRICKRRSVDFSLNTLGSDLTRRLCASVDTLGRCNRFGTKISIVTIVYEQKPIQLNFKQRVLYGTKDGRIGLVDLPPTDGTLVWEIPTQSTSGKLSLSTVFSNFEHSTCGR
uniref:Uncharacterized protein n=1 Tax=Parascaris equorum TaxID=6256 RepID=A0A914RIU2_PAREQ